MSDKSIKFNTGPGHASYYDYYFGNTMSFSMWVKVEPTSDFMNIFHFVSLLYPTDLIVMATNAAGRNLIFRADSHLGETL